VAVDQELVDAAIGLVEARFEGEEWAGAAALRVDDGSVLTSVAPSAINPAVTLCHETGALCEAYKLGRRVVASVCVTRSDQNGAFWILAPCGVCQERLAAYGPAVAVAIPDAAHPERWRSVRLDEVQPHWWQKVFGDEVRALGW
jgi:cytidine deaminase